jgi:hypothetical protein
MIDYPSDSPQPADALPTHGPSLPWADETHACGCTPYLCQVCNPRRRLTAALVEVGENRGLDLRQTVELIRPSNVVSMAAERRARR